jgi:hypothetical protein
MKNQSKRRHQLKAVGVGLGVVVVGAAGFQAQSQTAEDPKITQLEKDNQALQSRLDVLEALAKKEGLLPSGTPAPKFLGIGSDTTLSGFVTTSFFHDTSNPPGGISPGYLWNRRSDSFSLNKVKLTLASAPAERSGENFSAGYRVSFIAGQDAPVVNSGTAGIGLGIREAYVDLNVPVGTGLNVKMGELISLLNYESGDGGAANNNFSQGYQWFFTGNGPAAGIQLGYTLTDWLDVKFRVQNGLYAGPIDNNSSKTIIGAIDLKPTSKSWVNLLGFGGREDAFAQSVLGGSVLGGWQVTDQFGLGTELDLFEFYNRGPKGHSPVWSTGLWADYALTKQVDVALRGEFLSDHDGVDASGTTPATPGAALDFIGNTGQDISSVALTLNYKPLPNLKFQPEVRFDHTSLVNGFGTKKDRVIVGAGIIYYF